MDDRPRRPGWGRYPLGFLGALAMVAAVELSIVRHKTASYGGSHWAYQVAKDRAEAGDRRAEVLCFGDSLLKQGLAPPVIEAKSGLRAYNFAVAGGQAPGDYILLRKALEAGARPSAVVVEYFPRLMSRDPDFNLDNWPFLATPGDCLEMARLARDPVLFAQLAVRELLPSARCRNSIRDNIRSALDGTFPNFAREIRSARRNWEVNRGAEIVASRPDKVDDVEAWMRGYFPKFECTRSNRAYIKKFLDLAKVHQIPVFWVLPPYKPVLQARCEQSGFDAAHEAFIRGLQARYPVLYVIDGRRAGYDPRVFTDLHHLGGDGAAIFSAEVAGLLRQHRDDPAATPRWLRLADYRAVATARPLEDMDESRRKVHALAAGDPSAAHR